MQRGWFHRRARQAEPVRHAQPVPPLAKPPAPEGVKDQKTVGRTARQTIEHFARALTGEKFRIMRATRSGWHDEQTVDIGRRNQRFWPDRIIGERIHQSCLGLNAKATGDRGVDHVGVDQNDFDVPLRRQRDREIGGAIGFAFARMRRTYEHPARGCILAGPSIGQKLALDDAKFLEVRLPGLREQSGRLP